MRLVFMGSDELACPSLDAIHTAARDEVVVVVTQPDRPKGRNRKLAPCPLKEVALALGLPCMSPEKVGDPAVLDALRGLAPDLLVVVAYGQYLPRRVLDIAPAGAINLHPSLLPLYRGAAPIQQALLDGQRETGVTILHVSEQMDAGDIILQQRVDIADDDTAATLSPRLARIGADLLLQTLELVREGRAPRVPQDESKATCVHKLTKEDGRIRWADSAGRIRNHVRALQPWPGSFFPMPGFPGQTVRVLRVEEVKADGKPGEVLSAGDAGLLVATGEGAIRLLEVQPPGGRPMAAGAFLNGHPLKVGTVLE